MSAITKFISSIRREYTLGGLERKDLHDDPIAQFGVWFEQAAGANASGRIRKFFIRLYKSLLMIMGVETTDITAMTLATVDKNGHPSARVVLLKGIDHRGFIFYTNYESRKGQELAGNPNAALVFYWADQERQVCVTGEVQKLSQADSEHYFKSRPRGSRIAAWASKQSEVVPDRAHLETEWANHETKFPGNDVPLPPNWGGYIVIPSRIEFWQGRPNRLHDRFRYTRQPDNHWLIQRLAP